MKKVLALILSVALVFVLSACGGGAGNGDPAGGGNTGGKQVVVGINADYSTFDPAQSYEKSARMIMHEVYQTLFRFSAEDDSAIENDLAEDYAISDDGLTYVITMRQDVKAVTGKTLTAADAEFAFNRLINLKGNPSFLADPIASVEATGEYELTVTLKAPTPAILAILCDSAFSVYDSEKAQENGATLDAATDSAQSFFDSTSIGSGPYTLVSHTPNAETVMEKSETYVGTPAKIDRIVFKHINDSSMQLMSLQKGDIDFAFDLTASQLETLTGDSNIIVRNYPTQDIFFLQMSIDETIGGPLANSDLRRAIAYAVDYEGLRELAGNDPSVPMNVIPSGFLGYAGDSKITQNLDKAKEYLEKAGHPDGFSFNAGVIPDMATDGIAFMDVAVKIQSDLKAVGIEMNIQPDEVSVYLEKLRGGQYQSSIGMWGPDYLDPASQLAFMPGETVGLRSNWTAAMAPELAELTAQAKVETDPAKRAELIEEIQIMYSEIPGPALVFVQPNRALAMSTRIKNVHYSTAYMLVSHLMDI